METRRKKQKQSQSQRQRQRQKNLFTMTSGGFVMVVTNNTEEDGRKIKNIYNEKNCNFCLNLMVKIGTR